MTDLLLVILAGSVGLTVGACVCGSAWHRHMHAVMQQVRRDHARQIEALLGQRTAASVGVTRRYGKTVRVRDRALGLN